MGNSLRCCLACVLPCGALDLIRIVHLNGQIDELTGPVTAGEVLKQNSSHVLSKPSSQGVGGRILILSPDSELKKGTIYFLIPESSLPERQKSKKIQNKKIKKTENYKNSSQDGNEKRSVNSVKKASRRNGRRSHSGGWLPHLESILED